MNTERRNEDIARALANGAGCSAVCRVARPYASPSGFGGTIMEPEPGVWVAMERRVILKNRFRVGRFLIRWVVVGVTLYWAPEPR